MKGTLTFTLPEEREEFNTACKASSLDAALYEIRELLRREVKYDGTQSKADLYEAVCEICKEVGV